MRIALLLLLVALPIACGTTGTQRRDDNSQPPSDAPRANAVRVAPDAAKMEDAAAAASKVVGRPAPDFVLLNAQGKAEKLTDYKGKWLVVYFYPKDDTPGCVCEATEFTDLLWRFHRLDSSIIGISPDSPESHVKFTKKYGLQIKLLSDPKKQAMRRYGAWVETQVADTLQGRVVRSTFLIDPDGKIAYHWPEVIPEGHANRVRARLVKMQIERNEKALGKPQASAPADEEKLSEPEPAAGAAPLSPAGEAGASSSAS
ncbi:MAG: peroxiredoxin [Planctomycetota bacterium]|nr:peroxiredoxin [Planctomycetota bacterium]